MELIEVEPMWTTNHFWFRKPGTEKALTRRKTTWCDWDFAEQDDEKQNFLHPETILKTDYQSLKRFNFFFKKITSKLNLFGE